MALYKVDSDTADLTKVAGGTLYADLPIGSWIKNDMATIPSGFLKEGDTISQSEYPELYAKYGSTVPYKADTSELSEYENITLSTNSSNPTVMPYDGVYILANYGVQTIHHIYLNGVEISGGITGNNTTGASTSSTILFKKGDTMYRLNTYTEATFLEHVAYYKKSLIVKAKHVSVPFDVAEYIRNQNILSDWENITLPTTAATAITMQYDGFIYIDAHAEGQGVGVWVNLYVNGKLFRSRTDTSAYNINTPSLTVQVKKGDVVYLDNSPKVVNKRAAFYKLRDYTGR